MIACNQWRERLLAAPLADLEGEGTSPLVAHLRSCARCAEEARILLEATERLNADLDRSAPLSAATLEDLLARSGVRRILPRRRRLWPRLGAAAAAVLALLSLPSGDAPVAFRSATTGVSRPPTLEAGVGNAAILPTRNPDITVIWFF